MLLRHAFVLLVFLAGSAGATAASAAPTFADAGRRARLEALAPEIDRIYAQFARERNLPGLVHGLMLDGELIHARALGAANLVTQAPAALDTRFRIASMSKSFTAMAILRLRDAGKLTLADPVARHVPEFAGVKPPTRDAPVVRIDHLLAMLVGFPTDDPWGDRQLAMPEDEFRKFLAGGVSFSNTPGVGFEYSNLAYTLLGQIVSHVSGTRYQDYITREILLPLGMRDTVWDYASVPPGKLALGYRWQDNAWVAEPLLPDGAFGAMGGLLTTLPDFAKYAALHLAAWPARDDEDRGPVSRATVREMHLPRGPIRSFGESKAFDGAPLPAGALGYFAGLISCRDTRGLWHVRHAGGLPGYGSEFRFCPELGIALISFANRTYAGTGAANARVLELIVQQAKLPGRVVPVSGVLARRAREAAEVILNWQSPLAEKIFADNVYLDETRERRAAQARALLAQAGTVLATEPVVAENQTRGTFAFASEHGRIEVSLLLSPEADAKIQLLELRFIARK